MVEGGVVGRMTATLLGASVAVAFLAAGCVSVQELIGFPAESAPTVSLRTAETRWVLVKNPRFGDVPSEPEYIWVEEDKIPWTLKRIVFGKASLLAPPEIVAKYSRPPGGGKISPLQGGPYARAEPAARRTGQSGPRVEPRTEPGSGGARGAAVAPKAESSPQRGYVVFVDTNRVVIDLTAQDGLRPGSVVSLRRDRIPIIHPVTGELLGELDMEVATARVVEVREQFSVVEVQSVTPGAEVKVKDRVVPR